MINKAIKEKIRQKLISEYKIFIDGLKESTPKNGNDLKLDEQSTVGLNAFVNMNELDGLKKMAN